MGKTTEYLGLYEAADNDFYNVEKDQNENFTILDSKAKEVDETIKGLGNNKQDKTDNSLNTTDKTVAGAINELKSKVNKVIDVNGINSGLIIKVKEFSAPGVGGKSRIYFDEAFPNACFGVFFTDNGDVKEGGAQMAILGVYNLPTKSSFDCITDKNSSATGAGAIYIAIGY